MENVRHLDRPAPPADDHERDPHLGRQPPANLAAEAAALAGMLTDNTTIPHVAAAMTASDLYRPAHQTIYAAILDLHGRGDPADPIAVTAYLTRTGDLARAGGPGYIHSLTEAARGEPDYYAELVRETAVRRNIATVGTRITNWAYDGSGDLDELRNAARKEIADATADTTTREPTHLVDALIDWNPFFATDFGQVELLPGRLMAPGQQIALVGDGKAGKSLFTQEWMWRMATGQPFLGDHAQNPVSVLYIDAENGHQQIQERFQSFGAGPGRMGLLSYASFPPVRPLDTPGGGQDLLALAHTVEAQLVVIDTVSRFISGPENDSDTWIALYRHTLLPLKRAGIASVRLDHFGKDGERGARGSSAKTQDVDHVWELRAQGGDSLLLKRTHTRTGIGPDNFPLIRQAQRDGDTWRPGGTRHVLMTWQEEREQIPGTVEYVVAQLDKAGVPDNAGNPTVRKKLAELQIPAAKDKIEAAVRLRKNRANEVPGNLPDDLVPLPSPRESPNDQEGTTKPQVKHSPGTPRERPGNPPSPASPPSKEGEAGGKVDLRPAEKPRCIVCDHPLNPDLAATGHTTHIGCDQPPDEPP